MNPPTHTPCLRSSPVPAAAMAVGLAWVVTTSAHSQALPEEQAIAASPVVTIVKVPKPWYAPRFAVVGRMRDTVAQYSQLAGLSYKAFSLARPGGEYGGLYYWRDAASAKAWFGPAWFERVRQERGAEGQVRYFDAPVSIDNTAGGTPLDTDSPAVGTLVEIPIPAGVSRERLVAEFKAAISVYQNVPGLLRKHFTISDSATFGGLYVWKDEASATAWFNQAWHDRVRKTYGTEAKIEWFDTPILMPTRRPENVAAAGAIVVQKP